METNVTVAKVLLLGKSGCGKSSFVNYFLGKDVAETGYGKPVTQRGFHCFRTTGKEDGFFIDIYDTDGVEAQTAGEWANRIYEEICIKNKSNDLKNWYHTIFYCTSIINARLESFEIELIKNIEEETGQKICIILTNCDNIQSVEMQGRINNFKETICKNIGQKTEIFSVCSVSMKKRSGETIEPHGREKIVSKVFELLWKNISSYFANTYADKIEQVYCGFVEQIQQKFEYIIRQENFSVFNLGTVFEDNSIFLVFENSLYECIEKMNDDIDDLSYEFEDTEAIVADLFLSYCGEFYEGFKMPELDFFPEIDNLFNEDFIIPEINNIIGLIDSDSIFEKLNGIVQTAKFVLNIKMECLKIVERVCQQMIESFDKNMIYNHIYESFMEKIDFNEGKI